MYSMVQKQNEMDENLTTSVTTIMKTLCDLGTVFCENWKSTQVIFCALNG